MPLQLDLPATTIPTLADWKRDTNIALAMRSSDHVLNQIDRLIEAWHKRRLVDNHPEILFQIYRATSFWFEKKERIPHREQQRAPAIQRLRLLTERRLKEALNVNDDGFPAALVDAFGRSLGGSYANEFNDPGHLGVRYMQNDLERRTHKLSFRGGRAHKWTDSGELELYDTITESAHSGPGWAAFVMDPRGRIYTGTHEEGKFHHSTFMAGQSVLGAGEIKITAGKVMELTDHSGHYKPHEAQIVSVCERLQSYRVNMDHLKVKIRNGYGIVESIKVKAGSKPKNVKRDGIWLVLSGREMLRRRGDWS